MKDLFLIYIDKLGKDYNDNILYDFIFSDTIKGIDGDEWDTYPASGRPFPPHKQYIKVVGRLEADITLDLVQNSDTFAVWDAVDGVLPLGWENIDDYDAYPDVRLVFKFGETKEAIEAKLYEKDLILNYKK
jgi:hypothetical protein